MSIIEAWETDGQVEAVYEVGIPDLGDAVTFSLYVPGSGDVVIEPTSEDVGEDPAGTYRYMIEPVPDPGAYRIRWQHGPGAGEWAEDSLIVNPGSPTAPVPPYDAAAIRVRSPLLRQRYPVGGADEGDLLAVIEDASAVVGATTGRKIAPLETGEEIPRGLRGVAVRAVARMAELMDSESAADAADAESRGRRLRGFTAGPYSETYFSPGDLIVKNGRPQMSPDPQLDRLLWALATEDARDEWLAVAAGVQRAAASVSEFDYRRMGRRGGRGIAPQTLAPGPDGW